MSPGQTWIVPYYANLALLGVTKLNTNDYNQRIKNYLQWYLAKINRPDNLGISGTIYDYRIDDEGNEIAEFILNPEEKNYDSSDAYAGTFLSLVRAYYDQSKDETFINNNIDDLKLVANAINSTMQDSGLTWAKLDYHEAYLMDNIEVWRGYYDFAQLLNQINDPDTTYYYQQANKVQDSIETFLWTTEGYLPYDDTELNWNDFYPDAHANMWPIIFGLPEAKNRTFLFNKLSEIHPGWIEHLLSDSYKTSIAVAGIKANDLESVKSFINNINEERLPERAWPWHPAESGWLIYTYSLMDNINYDNWT